MRSAAIAVSVKNQYFAEEMAKGLAGLDRPYYIEIIRAEGQIDAQKNYEVLITDFYNFDDVTGCFEPYRVIRTDEETCRISILSKQIDAAVRKYRDSLATVPEQHMMSKHEKRKTKTVFFQSLWGGAGITALTLAAGRMLSGAYGERVLYFPLTERDGSMMYRCGLEAETAAAGNVPELFYRMKNQRPFCMSEFTEVDYSGLDYLNWGNPKDGNVTVTAEERIQFLELTAAQDQYDWILVDVGTGNSLVPADVRVTMDNLQDSRAVSGEGGKKPDFMKEEVQILIQNRGLENRLNVKEETQNQFIMELIDDGESFVTDETGKVELILSKSYAAGIKIFSEWLLETVANRVEIW